MSLATWDKINGALGSTNTAFGGDWGNLVSDYLNGVDVGIADPTKLPKPNTLTRYKHEKFGLFDTNESHHVLFSVNDIDSGTTRKITIRAMLTPFETDHMVMEGMSQTLLNKIFNTTDNSLTATSQAEGDILTNNGTKFTRMGKGLTHEVLTISGDNTVDWDKIENDNIDAAAAIVTTKLSDSANFVLTTRINTYGNFIQTFLYDTAKIMNSGNTFGSTLRSNATSARTATIPDSSGTLVMNATTDTLTNKTVNTTDNSLTATSQATGDILTNNGTKFVRKARGTALQVLRTNSGATDIEYASLNSENTGTATGAANGSATVFNIAHGLGSTPYMAMVIVSSVLGSTINRSFTYDATNIIVTFASAPTTGTITFQWRAIL